MDNMTSASIGQGFKRKTPGMLLAAVVGSFAMATANATTIFSQNFESGLGANESVAGMFSINNLNATLNNGTNMMGHAKSYTNDEYSYYQLALNLSGVTNAAMQFDYAALFENHFDRFNVLASTGAIVPPGGLITPVSGMIYEDEGDVHKVELGQIAFDTGGVLTSGTAMFDLSAFDGTTVNLRFQFGSDATTTNPGINFDNILVTGDRAPQNNVPEPATLALFGLGLAGLASQYRRNS